MSFFTPKTNMIMLTVMGTILSFAAFFGEKADEPATKGLVAALFAYVTFLHYVKVE